MVSTFLSPSLHTKPGDLASLHLRRDQSLPTILSTQVTSASEQGYAEGVVTNTRFGSFPHSTIIDTPWGSQIRASKVDTGSRGRSTKNHKKRKIDEGEPQSVESGSVKQAEVAESGFVHVLPPTPENWTTSLPHRTQVVYTPDYSYILHRIRARPGSRLIEAGSGSGSFTHAAARAVFNGYWDGNAGGDKAGETETETGDVQGLKGEGEARGEESEPHDDHTHAHARGRVFTYEFHQERHEQVKAEMALHGLDPIVHATWRDVYSDGFLIHDSDQQKAPTSPLANAVFLDLPAPWEALPHLTRQGGADGTPSVLDPDSTVHICTFSPCIEQAQKTVSALRRHDWVDIEMVEMQHKRLDVRREYTGLEYDGMRGANAFAADVDEAVSRLRDVEQRLKDFHAGRAAGNDGGTGKRKQNNQQQEAANKLPFNGGRLVHRTEPELKTHTSYLVFAILPRAWTDDDEAAAQEKWAKNVTVAANAPKSQRQLKKQAKQRLRAKSQKENVGKRQE
jgi:tRNA (adenine57-N1/adenine58-N1)-methyltransferase